MRSWEGVNGREHRMGFRLRRRRGDGGRALHGDFEAAARVLERAALAYGSDPGDFDLAIVSAELLERAPTVDSRRLLRDGITEDELYERELRPNWEGLTKGERAAKIVAFARFANALVGDTEQIAALVRTKLLVLAWAYDRTYGEGFLPRIALEPERFGRFELSATG
jgi:hypothetical protein